MSNMHNPAHPGEVLREYLPEDVSIGEVARHLGVTRQALSALLNGRAGVSASMALRLEGSLGGFQVRQPRRPPPGVIEWLIFQLQRYAVLRDGAVMSP